NQKLKIHTGVFTPYPTSPYVFKNGNVYTSGFTIPVNSKNLLKNTDMIGSDLIHNKELPVHLSLKVLNNENRIERFHELLVPKKIYTDKKIEEILNDTCSVTARKFTPVFLSMLNSNIATSAHLTKIYFNDWDFKSNIDEIPASIFYSLLNNMVEESYQDVFKEDISNNMKYAFLLYNDLFYEISSHNTGFFTFANDGKIRYRDTVFEVAFLNSMRFLNRKIGPFMDDWKWGDLTKEHYTINNPHLSYLSYFYKSSEKPIPGFPDALTQLFTNKELKPFIIESVKGYMDNSHTLLTANYSCSTNIASEFYYGRSDDTSMMGVQKGGKTYKTVINRSE
ncbi:MAG: penicillin acylase family protein, partial [Spirochaetota bacterium]